MRVCKILKEFYFPSIPADPVTRDVSGTVERFSPFIQNEYCLGFTLLLSDWAYPFRQYFSQPVGFLELTQPGDKVTVSVAEDGQMVGFVNHTLAERCKPVPAAPPATTIS